MPGSETWAKVLIPELAIRQDWTTIKGDCAAAVGVDPGVGPAALRSTVAANIAIAVVRTLMSTSRLITDLPLLGVIVGLGQSGRKDLECIPDSVVGDARLLTRFDGE